MAESKIISLKERKALLVMESDVLRDQIEVQCIELAGPAEVLMKGLQMAHASSSLFGFLAPLRKTKPRNKILSIPSVLFSLFKRH